MIERAGQGCAIDSALFECIQQPYVREGQRTGALCFGDQRSMALARALCLVAYFDPRFGRPSIPIETYLRLMHLRFRYRLGFETLRAEVSDSLG